MNQAITSSNQLIRFAIEADATSRAQHSKRALLSYHNDVKNNEQAHRADAALSKVATVKQCIRSAMRYESYEWSSFVRRATHAVGHTGEAYVHISGGYISAYAHGHRLFIEAIDAYTPDAAMNCTDWLINNVSNLRPASLEPLFGKEDEQTVLYAAVSAAKESPAFEQYTANNFGSFSDALIEIENYVTTLFIAMHEMNAYGIDIRPNEMRNAERTCDAVAYIIEHDITDIKLVGDVFEQFVFSRSMQAMSAPRAVATDLAKVFVSNFSE